MTAHEKLNTEATHFCDVIVESSGSPYLSDKEVEHSPLKLMTYILQAAPTQCHEPFVENIRRIHLHNKPRVYA